MSLAYFLREAAELVREDDIHAALVIVTCKRATYTGHVVNVTSDGVLTMSCVSRHGERAPFPVHVDMRTVRSFRYAELSECYEPTHYLANGPR